MRNSKKATKVLKCVVCAAKVEGLYADLVLSMAEARRPLEACVTPTITNVNQDYSELEVPSPSDIYASIPVIKIGL